jgi:hypothetical protein
MMSLVALAPSCDIDWMAQVADAYLDEAQAAEEAVEELNKEPV